MAKEKNGMEELENNKLLGDLADETEDDISELEALDGVEEEDLNNIIVLDDEDGNEVEFEFLDLIHYENEEYVVLIPTEEEADGEVVILKVDSSDDDTENYVSVESEEVLEAVFALFKEKYKDVFDFAD